MTGPQVGLPIKNYAYAPEESMVKNWIIVRYACSSWLWKPWDLLIRLSPQIRTPRTTDGTIFKSIRNETILIAHTVIKSNGSQWNWFNIKIHVTAQSSTRLFKSSHHWPGSPRTQQSMASACLSCGTPASWLWWECREALAAAAAWRLVQRLITTRGTTARSVDSTFRHIVSAADDVEHAMFARPSTHSFTRLSLFHYFVQSRNKTKTQSHQTAHELWHSAGSWIVT